MRQSNSTLIPVGFEQITGLNAVKKMTVPNGAVACLIQTEAQAVRMRWGTDPTSAIGLRLLTTAEPLMLTGNLSDYRFIEEAASAKLNVIFYGE